MPNKTLDVVAVGNAIVDILSQAEDTFLSRHGLKKGAMTLMDAGQEEGLLEEDDRKLIQSVVEFGDKTVREVMIQHPLAIPAGATVIEACEFFTRNLAQVRNLVQLRIHKCTARG